MIVDRGYLVPEVAEQLGVSAHSLYKWVRAVKRIGNLSPLPSPVTHRGNGPSVSADARSVAGN
jgi:transposase-like protein